MRSSGYSHHRAHLPIGTIALLFAVIAWGFHYKISLYQEQHELNTNITLPVKFLSEAEKSSVLKSTADSQPLQLNAVAVHFLAAEFHFSLSRDAGILSLIPEIAQPRKHSFWRFFPRPPPSA